MSKKKKDNDITKKPKKGKGDVGYAVVKSVLAAFPYIGGTAAEVFAAVVAPPISKRRDEWIKSIAERLVQLEKEVEGFKLDSLAENDMFITTVMHASQVAIRNHQEEKLEALRNAVLNSALGYAPEEDLQLMFLNFVDAFTPWHIKVLAFFDSPEAYCQTRGNKLGTSTMSSPAVLLEQTFTELGANREFYDQILNDLYLRGLVNTTKDSFHTMITTQGIYSSRTTEMGKKFISFITSPPGVTP